MLKIRVIVISLFFFLVFAGAMVRLADLQFNQAAEYSALRDQRITSVKAKAPRRGRILDADGNIIAEDQPTQDLWLVPARTERINRRREIVSNLPPLSPDQMLGIAASSGEVRNFEYNLARTSLVEANPLVAELASRLGVDPGEVADKLLRAVLRARTREELLEAKLAVEDVDFSFAMEIRSAQANPYDESVWKVLEVRTGGKRFYPAGKVLGHLTGTVGRLSPEEYIQLRGRWDGEEKVPGAGSIVKQGRLFFSILDELAPDGMTDEERIIRLREIKRAGKIMKVQGYFPNEIVGRGGLEQYYNQALRGQHRQQHQRLVWDRTTRRRRTVPIDEVVSAVDGADVRLSIKLDVQKKAYDILTAKMQEVADRLMREHGHRWTQSGVAIMMDPRNGRIHALVSLPSYDPNTFNRDFKKLTEDPAIPLLDRALAGIYPPGSVVKPIVGLAAQTEGAVMPGERFVCDRVLTLAGARFTCLGRHGSVDLESALMHSCNIYFYHAGEKLGGRRLYEWYSKMGMSGRTGIDVAGEVRGLLPQAAYTRRGWATGNTYHMAIGQGIAVTPLQIAVAYCALANAQGDIARIVRPHLLIPSPHSPRTKAEEDLAIEAMRLDQPVAEFQVDREALAMTRQGMWEVVQGYDYERMVPGTGYLAGFRAPGNNWLIEIAGKTGTAEWSQVVNGRVQKQISHVWFAAYAPFDKPEIVVVVMLPEAGGGGGGTCAPIAKELLRMWFNLPTDRELRPRVDEEEALG